MRKEARKKETVKRIEGEKWGKAKKRIERKGMKETLGACSTCTRLQIQG